MISRNFDLVLRGNDARLREKIYVYRGDYGIDLKFNILDSLDYYLSERNDLEGTGVTILFTNPSGDSMYTTESTIHEGFVTFRITEDMTDDFEEIGEYTLQIRLIGPDYRVTIPAFKFNVSPIISDTNGSIIGTARVGFARVAASGTSPVSDLTLFSVDSDGYIKTNWQNGDVITRDKMNKIESGIFDNSQMINDISNSVDDMGRDIRQLENKVEREIEQSLENVQNVIDTEVSTMQRNIRSLQRKVNENTQNISNNADIDIIQDSSIRALRRKVSVLEMLADGGSGVVIMALANVTDINVTTLPDHDVDIRYEYSASYDTAGIVTYNINGLDIRSEKIEVGVIPFNPRPYLKKGSNVINISVNPLPGDNGRGDSLTFNVEVIDVALNSNFNYQKIYKDVIDFNYTPVGAVEKTIHILVDETEIYTETVISSGIQRSYQIPKQSHGTHLIEAYMEAVVGGSTVTTNKLSYEIITVVEGNNTPIISMNYRNEEDITQYSLVSIPYAVYKDDSVENDVELFINNVSKGELVVDRSWKTWSTTDYPIGEVEFKITCGNVSRSVYVNVIELDVTFKEATEGLEFYMSSANRTNSDVDKDQYSYGVYNVDFNDFNWVTNGWIADNGIAALKICDGATVDIPITPFANDFKTLGKTIEFDFSIEDSINDNAIVCSCMSGDRGFQIKSKEAVYKTNEIEVITKFKDKERIRISFVVEGSGLNRMIYTYVDGVVSGLNQYTTNDIFTQQTPVSITLGSTECTIKLYSIRIYNRGLKINEVVDNFIYDLTDITRKLDLYSKNNVFDSHDQIIYDRILDQVPCMIITGELPPVKGEKKTVSIKYEDKVNFDRNFEYSGCTLDIQGTSSQYYPKKNYKFKLPELYALRTNSIPVNEFCLKADYMESSHAHNTGMAKFAESLYTEKVPPQVNDSRVRTTIDGFIIALFYRQTANSELEYFGVYNFNNDKGTPDTFGYSGNCECWEVCNNTSPRCLFQLSDYDTIDTGEGKPAWQVDFEARYPDKNTDYTALKRLTDWLVSTKNNPTKFKNEFNSYLNLHYTLMYYIITEFFAMADSRAKNLFLATWDKQIWYPVLYDMDTMMGLNNEGVLEFRHNVESSDTVGTQNVFNGKDSLLWINVEEAFNEEINALYRDLRNSGLLTYDTVTNTFINEQISKICQAQYNEDAQYKYISPLINDNISTYLYIAQGSREHHMKYWLDSRFKYMDSKFRGFEYMDNYATFRLYTPTNWSGVRPNPDFDITLFNDQYIGVKYGSYEQFRRAKANETVHITAPSGITFNDTETIIYGATNIASLGDLSGKYAGTVDVSKATQLDKLILGSTTTGYQNANLKSVSVGNNRLLRTINVANCPNLTGVLDLSSCVAIESVEARGSGITSVSLSSGGNLKTMRLPATITNLEIIDKPNLQTLELEGYSNVSIFNMQNAGRVNPLSLLGNCVNVERVRLMNLDCSTHITAMDVLLKCKGMTADGLECPISQAVSGRINITKCSLNKYNEYVAALPLATITVDEIIDPLLVTFKDGDGNVLAIAETVYGGSVIYPSNTVPTKTSTAQYNYVWNGWDRPLSGITSDCVINATFENILRSYTIRFIDGNTNDIISSQEVSYGSTPNKPTLPAGSNYWGVIETVTGPKDYISRYLPYPEDLSIFQFAKGTFDGKIGYTCLIKIAANLPGYLIIPFEYNDLPVYAVGMSTGSVDNRPNVTSIYMPESVERITGYGFAYYTNLTAIDTSNITKIENYAFSGSGVEELDFPKLTTIEGESTFRGCSKLRRVSIGQPISYIPDRAFYECRNLEIFECVSFTTVGISSFSFCEKLKTFISPEGLKTISDSAFDNAGLEYVDLPKSCTAIGGMAFYRNNIRIGIFRGITDVNHGLITCLKIDNNAKTKRGIFIFGDVDNPVTKYESSNNSEFMGSIVLIANADNVDYTNNATIQVAMYIDEVHISNTFTPHITDNEWYVELSNNRLLFGGCMDKNITSYDLSNVAGTNRQATAITRNCFSNFASLTSISGTAYLDFIPLSAFNGCKLLESTVDVSNARFFGSRAFNECDKALITGLSSKVEQVGSNAFYKCYKLTSANIPNATIIDNEAFCRCNGLTSADCSSAVKIGYSAFQFCSALENITLTNTSVSVGDTAFSNCSSLKNVYNHESITSVGTNCFTNCTSLAKIMHLPKVQSIPAFVINNSSIRYIVFGSKDYPVTYVHNNAITDVWHNTFNNDKGRFYIVTETGTEEPPSGNWVIQYTKENLRVHETDMIIYTAVNDDVAWLLKLKDKNITSFDFSSIDGRTITSIFAGCFESCTKLTSITIPEGVTSIGDSCFRNCPELTTVSLPQSLTGGIGYYCFAYDAKLASIHIPDNITYLGKNAFDQCKALTTVTGGLGVTSVEKVCFYFTSLRSINLPKCTTIGQYSFQTNTGGTLVFGSVGNPVTSIHTQAFMNCYATVTIYTSTGDETAIPGSPYGGLGTFVYEQA